MRFRQFLPLVALLPPLSMGLVGSARGDEFGCTVLLCVLNPNGWSSVATCVPPVTAAFRMVARGKPWPQCPEAGSNGRIGYERFHDCPAGTFAAAQIIDSDSHGGHRADGVRYQADPDGEFCARATNGGLGGNPTSAVRREVRSDPNYVDISSNSGSQRLWFNLRGYK